MNNLEEADRTIPLNEHCLKMGWLKCTRAITGEPVFIRKDSVEAVVPNGAATHVSTVSLLYDVHESIEVILEALGLDVEAASA